VSQLKSLIDLAAIQARYSKRSGVWIVNLNGHLLVAAQPDVQWKISMLVRAYTGEGN